MSIAPHFGPNNLADEISPDPLPIPGVTRPRLRILVTGWRGWPDEHADYIDDRLEGVIGPLVKRGFDIVLVHGDAPGGDRHAATYGMINLHRGHVTVEAHPADWKGYGQAAGPRRNAEMVALGADLCVAFPSAHSKGTIDCMKQASDAGIPTQVWPYEHCLRLAAERSFHEQTHEQAAFDFRKVVDGL